MDNKNIEKSIKKHNMLNDILGIIGTLLVICTGIIFIVICTTNNVYHICINEAPNISNQQLHEYQISVNDKYCKKCSDKEKTLIKERDSILKYINDKDYIITLEIDGNELDSVSLSNHITSVEAKYSNITFIIGGSIGIHDDIKKMSNYKLSFSKLTFPHQLFRVILLEQVYRTFKINNNEAYHK